jgi:hypothetical protein
MFLEDLEIDLGRRGELNLKINSSKEDSMHTQRLSYMRIVTGNRGGEYGGFAISAFEFSFA